MKRSKFFENWVFSAKDVTALSVTSCAVAGLTVAVVASASSATSTVVVFMMISPLGAADAFMTEGYGETPARATRWNPGAPLQKQPVGDDIGAIPRIPALSAAAPIEYNRIPRFPDRRRGQNGGT